MSLNVAHYTAHGVLINTLRKDLIELIFAQEFKNLFLIKNNLSTISL
jgi:hypothetical protein